MSPDMTERLRDFIVDELGWNGRRAHLTPTYPLTANRVIDSFGMFQLLGLIEAEWDVTIDESEVSVEDFATLDDLCALVRRKAATP